MRTVAWLVAAALVLMAAFAVAPALLAGGGYVTITDNTPLSTAFAAELVTSWTSYSGAPTPDMVGLIEFWRRWHAIKIVISALLTIVLSVLAVVLWRRFLRADTGRPGYASCAALVVVLALCAIVVLVANIQATVAPLSALLPLLPADPPPGELGQAMQQIHRGLVDPSSAYAHRPTLVALVDSQRRYLRALGLAAAVLTVTFAAAGLRAVVAGRVTPQAERRRRRTMLGFAVASAVVTVGAAAACAAALTSAADPATSLLEIFTIG